MTKEIKLLSSEEAAKALGITRQGLAHLVKQGYIKPAEDIKISTPGTIRLVSKYKFFTEESVYEYLESGKRRTRR
jgi:predicted site-specific integrase-resolvase